MFSTTPDSFIMTTGRDVTSAFVGSLFCAYSGQPFDTLKVRLQTPLSSHLSPSIALANMLRTEPPTALWKGVVPTTMGMCVENAVAFGINEQLKRSFPSPLPPLNCGSGQGRSAFDFTNDVLRPGLFGLGTGFCSSFVLISSEVVKTRTQMMTETVSSVDITKGILRERGLGGLFVGMDAQIMRDAPFYAVFFGSYEISKFGLFALSSGSIPEDVNYFLSGGIAGMVGWFVAMPFDVPKTILQSDPKGKVLGGYFPIMREVARKKGVINGLFAGLGPTMVRAFPSNAALFLGVEWTKNLFDDMVAS